MITAIAWVAVLSNLWLTVILVTGFQSIKAPYMKTAIFIGLTATSSGLLCGLYMLVNHVR
jgi:hypothetical protein